MKLSKKICFLALVLLILAGIIVVALKGFNVGLMARQHESLEIVIGKTFETKDIKAICKEVFGDKKVVIRVIEVFSDAVNINVESATDEEKQELVKKINEKYGLELKVENVTVKVSSNIRIRDMIVPYIMPGLVSAILITLYLVLRFRKVNAIKLLLNLYGTVIVTMLALASLIAVTRFPFTSLVVNGMVIIAILEVIAFTAKMESKYDQMVLEQSKNIK